MIFLWEHFCRHKPMIPEGTVDTSALNDHIIVTAEKLKSLIEEDPSNFRKMQIDTRYQMTFSPDYNETLNVCLYESCKCNMYAFQYYIMYSFIIPLLTKENIHDIKILSLGCGSMIDGLSLSLVLKGSGDSFNVKYTGVDIAEWPFVFDLPFETEFIKKSMQDYWKDCRTFDGNVIFFPTVLSGLHEYPDETGILCQGIEETQFLSDTICLMISYRSVASFNKDWQVTDWQKAQRIISALERKGYAIEDLPLSVPDAWKPYFHSEKVENDEGRKWFRHYIAPPVGRVEIKQIAPDFAPPAFAREYLAEPGFARKSCPYYMRRREQYLSRNPRISPGEEKPETVCRQQCPIMCNIYPRIFFIPRKSSCFQLFILRRS